MVAAHALAEIPKPCEVVAGDHGTVPAHQGRRVVSRIVALLWRACRANQALTDRRSRLHPRADLASCDEKPALLAVQPPEISSTLADLDPGRLQFGVFVDGVQ